MSIFFVSNSSVSDYAIVDQLIVILKRNFIVT